MVSIPLEQNFLISIKLDFMIGLSIFTKVVYMMADISNV